MQKRLYIIAAMTLAFIVIGNGWQTIIFSQSSKSNLPQSKLGVKGEMGFVITVIDNDSPLGQAGLKLGDIITGLNEQVTSIEKFQKDIATSAPGTTFEITYLRFNSTTSKFEEQEVTVKTIPFVSQTVPKIVPAVSQKLSSTEDECFGCCDNCRGLLPGQQECFRADRFTGKTSCRIDSGGRCKFFYCA